MRIIVFFDLPVTDKEARKRYTKFRKFLLNDGYDMLQYSVYCRICNGSDAVDKHINRLYCNVPYKGSVRVLTITDKQYGKMKFLVGSHTTKEKLVDNVQLNIF